MSCQRTLGAFKTFRLLWPLCSMQIKNNWIKVGALVAALGVVLGGLDLQQFANLDTAANGNDQLAKAVQFQLIHALAIVLTGIIIVLRPGRLLQATAWIFLSGILLFSGSIYLHLITGILWLEHVKLLGVIVLVVGWIMLVEGACPGWNQKASED